MAENGVPARGTAGLAGRGTIRDGFVGIVPVQLDDQARVRGFDPAGDSGVRIAGPERVRLLEMIRATMLADPVFRDRMFAQELRVGAPIRLDAYDQPPDVFVDAADSVRPVNRGALGSHTVDVGDIAMFPASPDVAAHRDMTTQGELIVHFVEEAMLEVERGGGARMVNAQSARAIFRGAHRDAIRAQMRYRQTLGQQGEAMTEGSMGWRSTSRTVRIPYRGTAATVVQLGPHGRVRSVSAD